MAKKTAPPKQPSSYELLATRIQKIINSTGAQTSKRATIYKASEESPNDWAQLLEEIAEVDNVTVAHQDDGGAQIFWVVPKEE